MAGTRDFISGVVWGGLVGAAIGMLMAPRSGDETRALLRERRDEFREQARETAENLREKANETAEQAKARASELQQRSRELIDENRERITRTAEAVKRTALESTEAGVTKSDMGQGQPAGARPGQAASPGMPGAGQERPETPAAPRTTPGTNRPPQSGGM